ncbi:hypothetical protein Tco_1048497, partial [Tanacetum coccineum]
ETFLNISPENKAHYDAEAEAIHLILTGIGDDIYSTIDACTIAKDMGIAIERLQQGESLNKQDVKTNPFLEFGEFTSRDGESIVSYYSRFYTMMNEMVINQLEVATMQENVRFLQQLQPEWSRFATLIKQAEELDKVSYHKLFNILKQYQNEVNEIRAKKIAKHANPLALVATAQHYPDTYYQAPKSYRSYPSPTKTSSLNKSYATTKNKGKKIAKPIIPHFKADWQDDTNEELDEQELEAHYNFMAKIQVNQNAEECDDELVVLANLIANLKLDTDENKKI